MKYKTIIADPPWRYSNTNCRGNCEKEYQGTMSRQNLLSLPVGNIAAKNSVLLLWCTWPMLLQGQEVMQSWGFRYVTGFPWIKVTDVSHTLWNEIDIKVPYGVGFWARGCSECVLIGRRGHVKPPKQNFIGLLSPNLYHSRKPDDLYEYAETLPDHTLSYLPGVHVLDGLYLGIRLKIQFNFIKGFQSPSLPDELPENVVNLKRKVA